jgi:hypothetical protein
MRHLFYTTNGRRQPKENQVNNKVRTIQFTIEETFTIETDLYDTDADALKAIKEELESGDLFPDTREYIGWDYSKVRMVK